jgi:riboflavin transporter FmnP
MKGNEAIAEAAIHAGCRHYFGYPITPQTEIAAYLAKKMPKIGGTFLQAESEIAAINMVYGVASTGYRVMTSSSSPGIALKSEGLSYLAGSDLPALVASFSMGPVWGVIVAFVKNLMHLLLGFSTTGGVGELSNFLLSTIFVATAGVIYRLNRSRKGALLGATLGALAMAGISILTNYFVMYPIYYSFLPQEAVLGMYQALLPSVDSILEALFIFNLPFTFAKGMLNTLLTFLIYKRISSFIQGKKED